MLVESNPHILVLVSSDQMICCKGNSSPLYSCFLICLIDLRTPARKLLATPTPMGGGATPLYQIPEEDRQQVFDVGKEVPGLPNLKPEDYQYFGALLNEEKEEELSAQEKSERKIMKLLLKVRGYVMWFHQPKQANRQAKGASVLRVCCHSQACRRIAVFKRPAE